MDIEHPVCPARPSQSECTLETLTSKVIKNKLPSSFVLESINNTPCSTKVRLTYKCHPCSHMMSKQPSSQQSMRTSSPKPHLCCDCPFDRQSPHLTRRSHSCSTQHLKATELQTGSGNLAWPVISKISEALHPPSRYKPHSHQP